MALCQALRGWGWVKALVRLTRANVHPGYCFGRCWDLYRECDTGLLRTSFFSRLVNVYFNVFCAYSVVQIKHSRLQLTRGQSNGHVLS